MIEEQLRHQAQVDGFTKGITIQIHDHNVIIFGHMHDGEGGCVMGSGPTISEAYRAVCAEKAKRTPLAWEEAA